MFLLDDLNTLLDQIEKGYALSQEVSNPDLERQKTTDLLQMIAWQIRFDEERHTDFDVQALQRWEPYKSFWVKNAPAHHLLLSKKYETAMSNAYLSDARCIQALYYDYNRGVYVSGDKEHKVCENGIFPVLLVGFKAHLQVMEDTKQTEWVSNEIEEFGRLTDKAPVAVKFKQDFEASHNPKQQNLILTYYASTIPQEMFQATEDFLKQAGFNTVEKQLYRDPPPWLEKSCTVIYYDDANLSLTANLADKLREKVGCSFRIAKGNVFPEIRGQELRRIFIHQVPCPN